MERVRYRMLVPLDGSPLAEVALSEALELAQIPESEVILLQVIPSSTEDSLRGDDDAKLDEPWERRKTRALHYLRSLCAAPAWRGVQTRVAVEVGRPAETILDFADRHNVARIIMATHGQAGLGRWVFGSVTDKVLHAIDRTVVLVYAGRPPISDRPTSNPLAD